MSELPRLKLHRLGCGAACARHLCVSLSAWLPPAVETAIVLGVLRLGPLFLLLELMTEKNLPA